MAPIRMPLGAWRAAVAALLAAWLWAKVADAADSCDAIGCGQEYHQDLSCQCNTKCLDFKNCCSDYDTVCKHVSSAAHHAPAPAHHPPAHHAPAPPAAAAAAPAAAPAVVPAVPVPPVATPPPETTTHPYNPQVSQVVNFDIYRAMAASAIDMHPMEDDDVADLGGVIKYIMTEIIVESAGNPLRTNRKYDIDAITKHRFKIRNSDKLLKSDVHALGEFGLFVTYDWGQATNTQQVDMLKEYGDFVGVQGCAFLQCDPRYPSSFPYSWFSLGNWCPNLPFDKKGTKGAPNAACLRDLNDQPLNGGLCPNGFDAANAIPSVDPTGQPGCVYSYGKAQTVMLDDLVGITSQDCGGVPCRNWLHFRQNCTSKELKQKFDMLTGQVVTVDYCVEHDIHPKCQANCDDAQCQAIINSGNIAYLGLPFWRDRCDPRANVRRAEQVAHALGIAGALSRHQVVDDQLAKAQCPASKDTSGQCVPIIDGQSGPFCTRYFNGACEPCYIPGTETGPDQKPHCPLDVFANYPGWDVPTCKSKRASEGCCLYDNSCEGSADPASATLDDDGYALVAGRQSTPDMVVFMKRAVQQLDASIASQLADASKVNYAAYSAWSRGPVTLKLSEAVKEFGKNVKGPGPVTSTATVTTTKMGCFELAMSFQPLDMSGVMMSMEANIHACQDRCARTGGCCHFTFMPNVGTASGSCHLQDLAATPQPGSVGYVAGPFKCWKDIEDSANLIDIGHKTYVPSELACIEFGMSYTPTITGLMQVISSPTREGAIKACQQWCAKTPNCAHFEISFPTGMCSLAPKGAVPSAVVGSVAGPPVCTNKDKASYFRLWDGEVDTVEMERRAPRRSASLFACVVGIGAVSFLGFMFSFVVGRRRHGVSIHGARDMAKILQSMQLRLQQEQEDALLPEL